MRRGLGPRPPVRSTAMPAAFRDRRCAPLSEHIDVLAPLKPDAERKAAPVSQGSGHARARAVISSNAGSEPAGYQCRARCLDVAVHAGNLDIGDAALAPAGDLQRDDPPTAREADAVAGLNLELGGPLEPAAPACCRASRAAHAPQPLRGVSIPDPCILITIRQNMALLQMSDTRPGCADAGDPRKWTI